MNQMMAQLFTVTSKGSIMKFTKAFDVWSTAPDILKTMQTGQHVYAGCVTQKGIYIGTKPSGVIVVAWFDNIRKYAKHDKKAYIRTLINYSKGAR